ncbi:hypothetical protein PMAYCL1PPCAC_13768, partial [Pristionchus mayeri]
QNVLPHASARSPAHSRIGRRCSIRRRSARVRHALREEGEAAGSDALRQETRSFRPDAFRQALRHGALRFLLRWRGRSVISDL